VVAKVRGKVQGGVFRKAVELPPDEQLEIPALIPAEYLGLPLFAFEVVGTSMNLIYPEGTFVIAVDPFHLSDDWRPIDGDRVIVRRTNRWDEAEMTVKEVEIDPSGLFYLRPRSTDPEFQDSMKVAPDEVLSGEFEEHSDSVRIVGFVIGSWRDERQRRAVSK
jgi:phage repressor protein C with HTH and peptisase S24 domain